jgi:hypothetical protein
MKTSIILAVLMLGAMPAFAKEKTPAPCKVYFSVVQLDPQLPGGESAWLNEKQKAWYDKHGDRDKVAGICYDPSKASYVIRWSESVDTVTTSGTSQQATHDTSGNWTGTAPVAATSTSRKWVATGFVFRVGPDNALTPISTVTSGRGSSASTSLLEKGLEAIAKADTH